MNDKQLITIKKDANTFLVTGNNLIAKSLALILIKPEDTQIASFILKECQKTEQELEEKRIEIIKPLNDFVREVNILFKETATPILEAKNTIKQKILVYNQEQERLRVEEETRKLAVEHERLNKLEEERLQRAYIEAQKRAEEEEELRAEQQRLQKLEEERLEKELLTRKANEEEQRKIKEEADRQRIEREKLDNERLQIERQKRGAEEERIWIAEEYKLIAEERIAEEMEKKKQAEMKVKGIVKRWSWEIIEEEKIPRAFCIPEPKKINEAIKSGIREIAGIRIFETTTVR